jgi:DNA-binding transcriptional ArsR family regulator
MTDPLDQVFAALADPTRRDLVARLASADATVGELAEPYEMSLQAVSKHVAVLERAGLVTKTRQGQRRTVRLDAQVFDLMTRWIERYRREAEDRFQRLDAVLAELAADEQGGTPGRGSAGAPSGRTAPGTRAPEPSSARTTAAEQPSADQTAAERTAAEQTAAEQTEERAS